MLDHSALLRAGWADEVDGFLRLRAVAAVPTANPPSCRGSRCAPPVPFPPPLPPRHQARCVQCGTSVFPHHLAERAASGLPADQHIVVAGRDRSAGGRRQPNDLPQAPPHAVAFHRIADLPRHREADAGDCPFLGAPPLWSTNERPQAIAVGRGSKLLRRLSRSRAGWRSRYALRRLRPGVRRAATTLRPPWLPCARKPCLRLRTQFSLRL